MAHAIVMPAFEMAQDSGTLVRWLKAEGEYVRKGEPLMEIETDKAVLEFEAPESGILSDVRTQAGTVVPVGQVVALLRTADETAVAEPRPGNQASRRLSPASPKARRLAAERGIDLSTVAGSGASAAVQARDLPSASAATNPEQLTDTAYVAVALTPKRRLIAERMQQSYTAAPHISLSLTVDVAQVREAIERLKVAPEIAAVGPLKITTILAKLIATDLANHPRLNSHFVNQEIRQFTTVHLGVAVAVDDGILVPVIRHADRKSLATVHAELEDLVKRARAGQLQPREMRGSTFTVSNLGMFGIEQFTSILNSPEVGILSVGCIREMPAQVEGRLVFRQEMQLTLNLDHRAVDGAEGAKFLRSLRTLIENPASVLV